MNPIMRALTAMLMAVLSVALWTFAPIGTAFAADAPCTEASAACHGRLTVSGNVWVPYYSSYPLTGTTAPTHAVIVLHGSGGTYDNVFERIVRAAELEGGDTVNDTVILSPRFTNDEQNPKSSEAYWAEAAWKSGDGAIRPRGLASFAVMDQIVRLLADKLKFPNLRTATLIGHSAGGQFNQRYAAVSRTLDTLSGLTLRIVVSNPSSYMYLNELRPDLEDSSGTRFIVPDVNCAYNAYKYGLEDFGNHAYLSGADPAPMPGRFAAQDVYYLLGDKDTGNEDLDTDCEARVQGKHRFERGTLFFNWVEHYLPSAQHAKLVVAGVGHDSGRMYTSAQGRQALFR